MKSFVALIAVFISVHLFGQTHPTIYFFPGQGSDKRIFDSLIIDPKYTIKFIEYGTPEKHATMQSFAQQLSRQIDTTEEFILVGVSLGGMICAELHELLNPTKTILISSAKNWNELPTRYKFQRNIPLYKIFSGRFLVLGAKFLQPLVEPDRKKNKKTFKSMLRNKKAKYMKRTIGLIIQWNRRENTKQIYTIHGTNDHTIPLKKLKNPTYILGNGSHMMTLTRANEVSKILARILEE